MMSLQILLHNVTKAPNNLISEARKKIEKAFPNMSKELINLIMNTVNSDKMFDLIQNPKTFFNNEFAKISDTTELNLLLGKDIPQKDLTKIYNLILYKFSSELADLGFDNLRNQEVGFSANINRADQILEQIQLQRDILATASLFGSNRDLSTLLIAPVKINPDSYTKLFESSNSQKVLGQMKQFSDIINSINSPFNGINTIGSISNDAIPIEEMNFQIGESITDTLQKSLMKRSALTGTFKHDHRALNWINLILKYPYKIRVQNRLRRYLCWLKLQILLNKNFN